MTARKGTKPKPTCQHCEKIDKSDNCWQMYPEKRPSARFSASDSTAPSATSSHSSENTIAFLSHHSKEKEDAWILDSGATQRMCNDKSQFTTFEPDANTITIANNSKMNATGKGTVKTTPKIGHPIILLNVLYEPHLASNLLSINCAMKKPDVQVNFAYGEFRIIRNNNVIATAKSKDSLSVLETVCPFAYIATSIDTLTWHMRLGHVNETYTSKISSLSISEPTNNFSCDACLKNKSTKIISRQVPIKATRPLERIHSDLAGPITPVSLRGNRYIITVVE